MLDLGIIDNSVIWGQKTMESEYTVQSAKDAQAQNVGDRSYWNYLESSGLELSDYFSRKDDPIQARKMLTRSLSEALQGNEGI